MRITIDIPEKTYKYAKKYANSPVLSVYDIDRCMNAISKGEIEQESKTEIKPIGYRECSCAMLKMWMDNVLTDGEYHRIMDKLNAKWDKNERGEQ